jgi:hypothetical protein
MIGVINPNSTETYDDQLAFAQNVTFQLGPGDPFPTESAIPTPTPGGSSSPSSPASPAASSSSSSSSGGGSSLSAGAIAGIAIGSAAVLLLAAVLIYLCGRRGGFDKAYRKSALAAAAGPLSSPAAAMGEAKYAGADAASLGLTPNPNPKSPGQTTVASFDGTATLRNSVAHHTPPPPPPPAAAAATAGVAGAGAGAAGAGYGLFGPGASFPGYGFGAGQGQGQGQGQSHDLRAFGRDSLYM